MKTARSYLSPILALLFVLSIFAPKGYAQLKDAIEQLTGDNTKGYLQPLVNSFANGLNSGIYRTAHVSRAGLQLYAGFVVSGTLIPEGGLTYMGMPPAPYPQEAVETATVFGGDGTTVYGPAGLSYRFQDGQLQGEVFPIIVPHIEIGSVFGTMAKARFFSMALPGEAGETLGDISLVGYGLQHSISQYFPLMPIDISAGLFTQKLELGEYLKTRALSYGLQAGKSGPFFTLYVMASVENTSMDVSYTYEGGATPQEVSLELETGTHFRIGVGAKVKLAILILNADISLGNQTTAALGLGLGL